MKVSNSKIIINSDETEIIKLIKSPNNLEKFHKDKEYELGEKDNIYHFNFIYSLPQNYKLSDYYNLFDSHYNDKANEIIMKKLAEFIKAN